MVLNGFAVSSVEEALRMLDAELKRRPRYVFRVASRLAADAISAHRPDLLVKIDSLRMQAFTATHTRLPDTLENPLVTLCLTVVGFAFTYLGGAHSYGGVYKVALLLIGIIMTLLSSHPFGHSLAGRLGGIGFNGVYLGGRLRVEPTLLLNLESYYRAGVRARFWFHLAGPLATLLSSVALSVLVILAYYPVLVKLLVALIPVLILVTEVVNSRVRGDISRAIHTLKQGVLC